MYRTEHLSETHVVDGIGAGLAGNFPQTEAHEGHLTAGSESDGVLAHYEDFEKGV